MRLSRATLIWTTALAMSLLACGVLAYMWIDRSITLTYVDLSMQSTSRANELMRSLLQHEWAGLSDAEVLRRLNAEAARRPQENIFVKPEPDEHFIWFDSTQFVFQDGRLVEIR